MNWGHKILIVIILFIVVMLGMVFYAFRQTNEMIDDRYYEKELKYQEVIDAQRNLMQLSTNNLVQQDADELIILFPAGSFEKMEKGTIELLRLDAENKDIVLPIELTGFDRRSIPKSSLMKGMYKARIRWTNGGREFYKEETVVVEK